jgi:hypothetical protein
VANFPVADSFNRALERDLSTGDIPHVFVGSVVWQVPIGSGRKYQSEGFAGALLRDWDIAAIVTRQSGIPLAVTQATNFNAFAGFGTQRPNRVDDPTLPSSERTTAQWFNLTNTPPLGAPNTVAGTPGFGAITSAGDPRVLQLAAKIGW